MQCSFNEYMNNVGCPSLHDIDCEEGGIMCFIFDACSLFASCQSSEMVGKDMVFAFVFYYLKVELQEGDNQSSIFVGSVGLVDEV